LGVPTKFDRGIALAHLFEHLFSRNAAIHQPDALGFAILLFDLVEKLFERAGVLGVARHHFVGQRKSLRGHHQGNNHLHTVAALVRL
jgi:hypothetical protein